MGKYLSKHRNTHEKRDTSICICTYLKSLLTPLNILQLKLLTDIPKGGQL